MEADRDREDSGISRPKVGLIVLQNDYTLEDDARRLLPSADSVRDHP